jgi:hypothetical protein
MRRRHAARARYVLPSRPGLRLIVTAVIALILAAAYYAVSLGYFGDHTPRVVRTRPAISSPSAPALIA